MPDNRVRGCGSAEHTLHRRLFLQGALAGAGATLSFGGVNVAQGVEQAAQLRQKQRSVLFIWLAGGASQFETWDPKPGRPTGGPFRAIPTSVAGTHVCELLPKLAQQMDKLAVIRSLNTKITAHEVAADLISTGRPKEPILEYPEIGVVLAKELAARESRLPDYVSLFLTSEGRRRPGAGYLGSRYAPLLLEQSLRPTNIKLPEGVSDDLHQHREDLRRLLSSKFQQRRMGEDLVEGYNSAFGKVRGLMQSDSLFDLEQEPAKVRDRYGRTEFGQHCLLARRLIEAGVPMVKVARGFWDSHHDNFESHRELTPDFDHVLSVLLNDLEERRLLEQTLIVVLSEFGRTPVINKDVGRDHYAAAWSCVLAGHGVQGGVVHGKTDADGKTVAEGEVSCRRPHGDHLPGRGNRSQQTLPGGSAPRAAGARFFSCRKDGVGLTPDATCERKCLMAAFAPQNAKAGANAAFEGIFFALASSPDAARLYAGGMDFAIYEIDPAVDKPAAKKIATPHESYVSCLALVDGVLVSGGFDHRLVWTDSEDGHTIRSQQAHDGWLRDMAVFPDKSRLATVGDDMLLRIWRLDTGDLLHTLPGHAKQTPQGFSTALYAVAVSPDGKLLASADRIGEVRVWNADNGALLHKFQAPEFYTYDAAKRSRSIGGIRSLCFSPDGQKLAVAGIGQVTNVDGFVGPCRVEVWDIAQAKRVFVGQDGHKAVLNHVAFHPESPWLVAAGGGDGGGLIAFWNQQDEKPAHKAKLKGHVQRFTFDPSGTGSTRRATAGCRYGHSTPNPTRPTRRLKPSSDSRWSLNYGDLGVVSASVIGIFWLGTDGSFAFRRLALQFRFPLPPRAG